MPSRTACQPLHPPTRLPLRLPPPPHPCRTAGEVKAINNAEDWGLCMNGTRNEGAVKGAVLDFAAGRGLTVAVTYAETVPHHNPWATWLIRKPGC